MTYDLANEFSSQQNNSVMAQSSSSREIEEVKGQILWQNSSREILLMQNDGF